MFWQKHKKYVETKPYDASKQTPAIRASICTGEQVAGFKDRETGKFHEAAFIRNEKELKEFIDAVCKEIRTKEIREEVKEK